MVFTFVFPPFFYPFFSGLPCFFPPSLIFLINLPHKIKGAGWREEYEKQYNVMCRLYLNKKGKKTESKKEIRGEDGGESNLSTWKKITLARTEE